MSSLKKSANPKKQQRGDTLIEIAFALVIIGFIVAVAIQGAIKAHQAAVTARKRTQATFIAKTQLEMLQVMRNYFLNLDPDNGWGDGTNPDTMLGQLRAMGMDTSLGGCNPTATRGSFSGTRFHAFPSPKYEVPIPKTVFLNKSELQEPDYAEVDRTHHVSWTDLNGNTIDSTLLQSSFPKAVDFFGMNLGDGKSIGSQYTTTFIGFEVGLEAYLTDNRPSSGCVPPNLPGFGLNDVTITATVSWQDGAGKNQEVIQTNRISNNI